jgi:serine/threonine protein kinase
VIRRSKLSPRENTLSNVEVKFTFYQISNSLGTTFVVDDKYEYIKKIGHGAYGVVCSSNNKKNGQKVAIKKVPPEIMI